MIGKIHQIFTMRLYYIQYSIDKVINLMIENNTKSLTYLKYYFTIWNKMLLSLFSDFHLNFRLLSHTHAHRILSIWIISAFPIMINLIFNGNSIIIIITIIIICLPLLLLRLLQWISTIKSSSKVEMCVSLLDL